MHYSFVSRYVLYLLKTDKINGHFYMVTDRKQLKTDFTGIASNMYLGLENTGATFKKVIKYIFNHVDFT